MGLSLYRRHRRDCKAGHPEESLNSEFDERKKGWKRCECPIFAAGTFARSYKRKSTNQWEWANAKTVAVVWERAQSWEGEAITPAKPIPESDSQRVEVERATKVFIVELKETAAPATQKKYRLMAERLKTFGSSRGYVMIDQFEPADIRAFRSSKHRFMPWIKSKTYRGTAPGEKHNTSLALCSPIAAAEHEVGRERKWRLKWAECWGDPVTCFS